MSGLMLSHAYYWWSSWHWHVDMTHKVQMVRTMLLLQNLASVSCLYVPVHAVMAMMQASLLIMHCHSTLHG
jgi:ABC-type antimicrobial peptide transport system ATPase subunit